MVLLALPRRSGPGRPLSLLVAFVTVLAVGAFIRARVPAAGEGGSAASGGGPADAPCEPGETACLAPEGPAEGTASRGQPPSPEVPASEVCLQAGYLCVPLEDGEEVRIVRWNLDTERIRIRVPTPRGVDPARARALRNAAARGVRAWHNHPFPLRVDLSDTAGDHDIVLRWQRLLGGRELGRTQTRWVRRGDRADLEVREFALATQNPWDPTRDLDPRQVELTAAHEMGHALGLPHSDRPGDVMYPENTATRLTARDFATLNAIYSLENGAFVR